MDDKKFLELTKDKKLDFLIGIEDSEREKYLKILGKKSKNEYFYLSGRLKSYKANIKSREVKELPVKNDAMTEVEIKYLKNNPYQPRISLENDKLLELAKSLKKDGQLQPIVVNKTNDTIFHIIGGHSRRDALVLNGESKANIYIYSSVQEESLDFKTLMLSKGLIENIQRNDLDPLETALSFQRALNEKIYKNQQELANAVGKSRDYVSKMMSILKLTPLIIKELSQKHSVKDMLALYFLQRIKDEKIQEKMFFQLANKDISREDIMNYVESLKKSKVEKSLSQQTQISKNKLTIKRDFSGLDYDEKEKLKKEIDKLIAKYI